MTHAFAKTYLNLDGTPYNDKKGDTYKTFAEETSGRDYRLNQTIRGADYTCKDKEGVFVPTPANMTGHSLTGYQFTKYVMDDIDRCRLGKDNRRTAQQSRHHRRAGQETDHG